METSFLIGQIDPAIVSVGNPLVSQKEAPRFLDQDPQLFETRCFPTGILERAKTLACSPDDSSCQHLCGCIDLYLHVVVNILSEKRERVIWLDGTHFASIGISVPCRTEYNVLFDSIISDNRKSEKPLLLNGRKGAAR